MPARIAASKRSRQRPGAREQRRHESLPHAVDEVERLLEVSRALEDEDRAERLLLHDRAVVRGLDRRASGDSRRRRSARRRAVRRERPGLRPPPRAPRPPRRGPAPPPRPSGPPASPGRADRPSAAPPRRAVSCSEERVEERVGDDRAPVGRAPLAGEGESARTRRAPPPARGPRPPRRSRRCCRRARPGAGSAGARRSPAPPSPPATSPRATRRRRPGRSSRRAAAR